MARGDNELVLMLSIRKALRKDFRQHIFQAEPRFGILAI